MAWTELFCYGAPRLRRPMRGANTGGLVVAMSAGDFATFRFSTDALPERDRLAIWRDELARKVVDLDMTPLDDVPFRVEATMLALPGLGVATGSYTPVRVERTRALAAGGNDDIVLQLSANGTVASQFGRETEVKAGEAFALATAEVSALLAPSGSRFLALGLARKRLAPLVRDLDAAIRRPVPRAAPALRMLIPYVKVLGEESALLTPELRELAVSHVYDLAALALGATREGKACARGGVAAARLQAIKSDIIGNLSDPDLTVGAVAARHGITPRYVGMLFAAEAASFSDFVLDQRLCRAYRLLVEPRLAARHIGDIAFACGFGDLSYFNRAFRRRFGDTPSGMRARA